MCDVIKNKLGIKVLEIYASWVDGNMSKSGNFSREERFEIDKLKKYSDITIVDAQVMIIIANAGDESGSVTLFAIFEDSGETTDNAWLLERVAVIVSEFEGRFMTIYEIDRGLLYV